MPISRKRHTIVCKVCGAVLLSGTVFSEHLPHGQGAEASIEPRLMNPAALTPGGEHPIESARGFAGLSLTYEIAAVTTSSGVSTFMSSSTPYRPYYPDASAIWLPVERDRKIRT